MECGARAILKRGERNIPHFAHASHDQRGYSCELRSAPADTSVEGGRFFRDARDNSPIREANVSLFEEASPGFEQAAQLKLWLRTSNRNRNSWAFQFHLGLPQLSLTTPGLTKLHRLALGVRGLAETESHAWRLWPGQGEARIPVPMLEHYELDVDPDWPDEPGWRKESLERAHVGLLTEGNAFVVEDEYTDCLEARLVSNPSSLLPESRVLNITQDPSKPPAEFSPSILGDCCGPSGIWTVWSLTIPFIDELSEAGAEWLESRAWGFAQNRTVRLISPPPVGFEGLVPIYPRGVKGWLLMETDSRGAAEKEIRAWRMDPPPTESRFVIPDGRAPGKVMCSWKQTAWECVPHPELLITKNDEPLEAIPLMGRPLERTYTLAELRELDWVFRSIIPLRIFAGSPAKWEPFPWKSEGRIPGLMDALKYAVQKKSPFQVLIQGPGMPRQILEIQAPPEAQLEAKSSNYLAGLKRRAGWPAYTHC